MYNTSDASFHLDRILTKIPVQHGMESWAALCSEYFVGGPDMGGWNGQVDRFITTQQAKQLDRLSKMERANFGNPFNSVKSSQVFEELINDTFLLLRGFP